MHDAGAALVRNRRVIAAIQEERLRNIKYCTGDACARICFVTEVDHDKKITGAIISDLKMLRCLEKFGEVDVIYLQMKRYRSLWLALCIYIFQVLRSLLKPYSIYISRSLIASFLLTSLRGFKGKHKKIVQRALSVPFPSSEIKFSELSMLESFVRYYMYRFLEINVLPNVDVITVAASDYARELIDIGVEKDRIRVVPFYVENEFFKQSMKYDVGESFTFCYVGGFHGYHDLRYLIEAFALFNQSRKNVKLYLIGDGPQRPTVEKEVARRNLGDEIRFFGAVPHSRVPSLLSRADSFIILMQKSGISTGLLEAAAAGKAIITVRRKKDIALNRYFRHMKEMYFVDDVSPAKIAKAMELLYTDSRLRNALAEGAREVAREHFSEEVVVRQLENLIRNDMQEP